MQHTPHIVLVYNDGPDKDDIDLGLQLCNLKEQLDKPHMLLPKKLCKNYEKCEQSFYNKQTLTRHKKTCHNEKYKCSACQVSLANRMDVIKNHEKICKGD